jgi:hypothetical protein
MAKHLDEMQSYIRIAENITSTEDEVLSGDLTPVVESQADQIMYLLEDLDNMIFRLKSYRELNENQNYALGIEEGLNLAAEMLARVTEKYRQADVD